MRIRRINLRIALSFALLIAAKHGWAATYSLTDGDNVIGEDIRVATQYSDTLYDLARKYGVGSEEIMRANPHVDPWVPGEGTQIVIPGRRVLPPGPREGIVVNIPEHRLYYYPQSEPYQPRVVITYPVSIGQMDWSTPLGKTQIVQKIRHPSWYPPLSIRKQHEEDGDPLPAVVPPGPNNPLGDFAMRLSVAPGDYLIHGTNNPLAVGMPVTHGCVRLYPEDIEALFAKVPNGTNVYLINNPIKVGFLAGQPWLEVHPPVDAKGQTIEPDVGEYQLRLLKVLGHVANDINWDLAREALGTADGKLVAIGQREDQATPMAASLPPRS